MLQIYKKNETYSYKLFFLFFCLLLNMQNVCSQNNQLSFGFHLNNRGYGLETRLGVGKNLSKPKFLELGIWGLKAIKEQRISNFELFNPYVDPGPFVYGKINHAMMVQTGVGFTKTIAQRTTRNNVGVYLNTSGGILWGLIAPVFIDYHSPGANEYDFITARYNPEVHQREFILQSRSFWKGKEELGITPGVYFRQGLVLEFGNYMYAPNKIETGFMLNTFFNSPNLLYKQKYPSSFLSFYISFALLNLNT